MKKNMIRTMGTVLCACFLSLFAVSCADVNGLHNQSAAQVTFIFENMGDSISGNYTIPGNFNDWDNSVTLVTLEKGNGTSEAITVSKSNIQFTLIQTGDSGWLRTWYPDVKGNAADTGTAGAPYQNFYVDGLDLSAGEITILIDGSTGNAIPKVQ